MSKIPQPPHSGNSVPGPRDSSPWVDLIAFLAVLCLGGLLIAFGRTTAGSLATICAALGGLYAMWTRRSPAGPPSADEPGSRPDENPREP
jgi:hypothetical protein